MSAVRYVPPVNPFNPASHLREWALFQSCLRAGLFLNVEGWRDAILKDAQARFGEKFEELWPVQKFPDKPREEPTTETFGAYLRGWAWAIQDGDDWLLCDWAEPSKERLARGVKPSSEATPVYIAIVPMAAYRARLPKGAKRG